MTARRSLLPTLLLLAGAPLHAMQAPADAQEGAADAAAQAPPAEPRVAVHGLLDARFANTDPPETWLEGGVGRLRYGGKDRDRDGIADQASRGFHLAQASLVVDARVNDQLKGHVHVNLDTTDDRKGLLDPVGIVEAFAAWTHVLSSAVKLRLRGGIMIPPFSLEHPGVAWSTRYTITPSAIGSWLGEEVKSTGIEGTLTVTLPGFTELDLQGAAFTGNDSTGALLAWRGWALHDRQGQIGDELPLPPVLSLTDSRFFAEQGLRTQPFHEIDGRIGYHAQARLRMGAHGQLQGGWYDSNGDVNLLEQDPRNYTWKTSFAIAGAEINLGPVTLLGQYLDGRAKMGFVDPERVDAPFRAGYGMISLAIAEHRVSLRYDRFRVGDDDLWLAGKDLNDDVGHAVTAAYFYEIGEHHKLELEYIDLRVDHPFAETAGEAASFTQKQIQAGYRLSF